MTKKELKARIAITLFKNQDAITAKEVAEELGLDVKKTQHFDAIREMVEANEVEKIGAKYVISDFGLLHYGLKTEVKKPVVEVIAVDKEEVKQVVEMLVASDEPVNEEITATENQVIVAENLCGGEITECEIPENLEEIELTEEEIEAFEMPPTMPPKHSMTPESFQIWQIVDEAGAKMIELLNAKKAKPIENIDYKIATLDCLADILNSKHSATLREIAADLRG